MSAAAPSRTDGRTRSVGSQLRGACSRWIDNPSATKTSDRTSPLYADESHWGQQKEVKVGVTWKGKGLGVHPEALRSWVKQAEIDGGSRPGTSTDDKKRIAELEREVRELRRANDILKAASAYFARELDPRLPR